jgi:hypothetical protein
VPSLHTHLCVYRAGVYRAADCVRMGQDLFACLLSSGVQQVRVVLRAVALLQLAKGISATACFQRYTSDSAGNSESWPSLRRRRPGAGPLRKATAGSGGLTGRQPGGRRSREAQTASASGQGNHPDFVAPPRPQAVAGKKCGASPTSMRTTSPRWKTFWRRMNSPTIPSAGSVPG